jgi:hypothetical protein
MNTFKALPNFSMTVSGLSTAISVIGLLTATALPSAAASFGNLKATGLDCTHALVTAGDHDFLACAGAFEGNDTGNGNPLLTELNNGLFDDYVSGGTWSLLGKSDEGDFNADQGQTIGNWSLAAGDTLGSPFVLSLKASNSFSAYLFNDVSDIIDGTFTTAGVSTNKNGKSQDLSHASLFVLANAEEEIVELSENSFSASSILMFLMGAPMALALTKTKKI